MSVEFALKLPIHGQHPDTSFSALIDLARQADDVGFSSIYVIDHLLLPAPRLLGFTNADPLKPYFSDAWCTLGAVAAVTKRVRLGPQVTPIGLRHPVFVAKWAATLDRISNGRFRLGVGLGHQEVEYVSHGFPFPSFKERYERLTEGVEIIRSLFSQEAPVTFEGKHYSIKDVTLWPKPVQSHLPIWYGGTSAQIRRGVARRADGWFPAAPQLGGFGPQFFRESIDAIRVDAAARGRTDRIGAGALFQTMISHDRALIERSLQMLRKRPEYTGLSHDEINDKGTIMIGTPDEVCRRIEPYAAAGVEEFTFLFHPLDDLEVVRRGIDLYAEHVIPRFA